MDKFDVIQKALREYLTEVNEIDDRDTKAAAYSEMAFFLLKLLSVAAYASLNKKGLDNFVELVPELLNDQFTALEAHEAQFMKDYEQPKVH